MSTETITQLRSLSRTGINHIVTLLQARVSFPFMVSSEDIPVFVLDNFVKKVAM